MSSHKEALLDAVNELAEKDEQLLEIALYFVHNLVEDDPIDHTDVSRCLLDALDEFDEEHSEEDDEDEDEDEDD